MQEQSDKNKQLNKAIELFITGEISLGFAAEFCDIPISEMVKILKEQGIYTKGLPSGIYNKESSNYQKTSINEVSDIVVDEDLFANIDEPLDIEEPSNEQNKEEGDLSKEENQDKKVRQPIPHKRGGFNHDSAPSRVFQLLKARGSLHIKEIIKLLNFDPKSKDSLNCTLNKYVNKNKIFVRVAPGCYGLAGVHDNTQYKKLVFNSDSMLVKALEILKIHRELSVNEIGAHLKFSRNQIKTLRRGLDNCVKNNKVFTKVSPGYYGLISSSLPDNPTAEQPNNNN